MAHDRQRFCDLLDRMRSDTRGNVALIFGVTVPALAFAVGAALDYSGASDLKSQLQRATDATILQLCKMPTTTTSSQLQQAAATAMTGFMNGKPYQITTVSQTSSPRYVLLEAKSSFATAIVGSLSARLRTLDVDARAQCYGDQTSLEIALVLDTTGSMANSSGGTSKIQAMKTAATTFVNSIFDNAQLAGNTKIALVPFAASVAVDPATSRNANWVDRTGKASYHWSFLKGGASGATAMTTAGVKSRLDLFSNLKTIIPSWDWAGCFESLPYPLNVQDGQPTPSNPDSYYVPMFAPDESNGAGVTYRWDNQFGWIVSVNSYLDDSSSSCPTSPVPDEATKTGQACKYLPPTNPQTYASGRSVGPNTFCTSRPLTRLTTNRQTLLNEISALQANGNTDIHEGVTWGWRALSPNSVFGDGAPYGKANNQKIIVLMTDGTNTWTTNTSNPTLKSYYSAYGYAQNPDGTGPNGRLPAANANPADDAAKRAAIDALTLESCRNAAANNVIIYTIGFSVASDPIDQQGIAMLKTCAGSANRAYVATDSSSIVQVFKQIASSIGNLRLTQ